MTSPSQMEMNDFAKYLESQSAQKLLQLLTCCESLSDKKIAEKTKLSERKIHVTLNNLEKIDVIITKSSGKYSFSSSKFTVLLKDAYSVILEEIIGKALFVDKAT
jgi:predicted transcriptional regulator